MKLAVVVQRYGADINGGAELHARYIAERLSRHADVEVLTTCARDYITWRNELPEGVERVNSIPVRRFPVSHERRPLEFGRRSRTPTLTVGAAPKRDPAPKCCSTCFRIRSAIRSAVGAFAPGIKMTNSSPP